MFKQFWQNLSRTQRIVVVFVIQGLLIIILASVVSFAFKDKERVEVTDGSGQISHITNKEKRAYEEALWDVISEYVDGVDRNLIKDAVVREDSYSEEKDEDNGSVQASFLIDIDSIRMTYRVVIGWVDDDYVEMTTPIVDCPIPSESKYPESVCYGTYRNSFDLSLYLPYTEYPDNDGAPNYMISGNDADKTIDIMVSACDAEKFKKQAMDYLKSTPIKLDDYTINYEVNSVDIECE